MRAIVCLLLLAASIHARGAELQSPLKEVLALLGTLQTPALVRDMCAQRDTFTRCNMRR